MQTVLKVFIEFVTILLPFYVVCVCVCVCVCVLLRSMWDLNTQPRDQTHTPWIERGSYSLDHLGSPSK